MYGSVNITVVPTTPSLDNFHITEAVLGSKTILIKAIEDVGPPR
jgi:hypothetical protein